LDWLLLSLAEFLMDPFLERSTSESLSL
jgi:hypothetical protein